jgi:hypothetical protein
MNMGGIWENLCQCRQIKYKNTKITRKRNKYGFCSTRVRIVDIWFSADNFSYKKFHLQVHPEAQTELWQLGSRQPDTTSKIKAMFYRWFTIRIP